jgi:hypothetical protein
MENKLSKIGKIKINVVDLLQSFGNLNKEVLTFQSVSTLTSPL